MEGGGTISPEIDFADIPLLRHKLCGAHYKKMKKKFIMMTYNQESIKL